MEIYRQKDAGKGILRQALARFTLEKQAVEGSKPLGQVHGFSLDPKDRMPVLLFGKQEGLGKRSEGQNRKMMVLWLSKFSSTGMPPS